MNTRSPRRRTVPIASLFVLAFSIYFTVSALQPATAAAEAGKDKASTQQLPTYFPNTEVLRGDEMRITALGT